MSCECDPPCPPEWSFADHWFMSGGTLTAVPRLRFGDDWVETYRDGDRVYADHDGKRYRVVSHYGHWNTGISEIVEEVEVVA